MRARLALNILLLILVIGLAYYLINKPGQEQQQLIPLTNLTAESVNNITILRRGLDDIRFIKQDDDWVMQRPYNLAAYATRVRQLLQLLNEHSLTQLQINSAELSRFHLDNPSASIIFNTTQIDFGDTNPLNETRYVRVNDTVHLVNDTLYQQLRTSPTFYLDPRLLPTNREIRAIHLPEYELRNVNGEWSTVPVQKFSSDELARLIQAWRDISAITVQRYETAKSYARVKFEFKEGEPLVYELVGDPGKPTLARPDIGVQYHISGYDKERLFPETKKQNTSTEQPVTVD